MSIWFKLICQLYDMGGANLWYSKCSNAMSKLGIALFTRLISFVEALINMVCELRITSGSKKNCAKIQWWSDSLLNSY